VLWPQCRRMTIRYLKDEMYAGRMNMPASLEPACAGPYRVSHPKAVSVDVC
jgi:hypothetical protein